MNVLIIDCNILPNYFGAKDLSREILKHKELTLYVRRGPSQDWSEPFLKNMDRIIISGSLTPATANEPWISSLLDLIRWCGRHATPLLGVCFGHQMIARAYGGDLKVQRAKTPEIGWTRINKTHSNSILKSLPSSFYSFSSHLDEVIQVPNDFQVIASSDHCQIQAFRHLKKPLFGIQFHPEKSLNEGQKCFSDYDSKKWGSFFLNKKEGVKYYSEEVGKSIFNEFLYTQWHSVLKR
ncbi:MAG: hypothetical protein CL678_10910 [Bdellovibrionaceae bacterium]|nr:hypothetical protein [Pseudobdellovibrionaceae bacterium]|tara:strand:+ start:3497 stop:4207 length:711 start_codon:yes stop_codon:yes gene_type:complete